MQLRKQSIDVATYFCLRLQYDDLVSKYILLSNELKVEFFNFLKVEIHCK